MIIQELPKRLKFALAAYNFGSEGQLSVDSVRYALRLVSNDPMPPDQAVHELLVDAKMVVDELLSIPQHEAAALIASFCANWEARRLATGVLHEHYRPILSPKISHYRLREKLVTRHYIAERERTGGWSIASLGREYGVDKDHLERADVILAEHAKTLEKAALQSLSARLERLTATV